MNLVEAVFVRRPRAFRVCNARAKSCRPLSFRVVYRPMKTICPNCSAEVEWDPSAGSFATCPACDSLFEPTVERSAPASADDFLARDRERQLRADIDANFAAHDRARRAEALANVTNAVDKFGRESRKVGCGLLQGVIALPIFIFLVFLLRSCVTS